MRKAMSITLVLVLAFAAAAYARPVDETQNLDKLQYLDMSGRGTDVLRTSNLGVFGTAAGGTTYYGGTYWAADSARWEALEDSVWTFDTGVGSDMVGSSSNPYVDPSKDGSLHATMEGWTGFDNTFSEVTYFRRSTDCPAASGYGMHCGVTLAESKALCYAAGAGYGNAWNVCIGHPFDFTGSAVTMTYDYYNESEDGYDFSRVVVDTVGNGDTADDVIAVEYTGNISGSESLSLQPGSEMPASPRNGIIVKFCFQSDGAWSDEDGSNPTVCGAFTVDNVALSGGISYALQDFETDNGGWVLQPAQPGLGGDWSDIVHLNDLPLPLTPCECAIAESVMVFNNLNGQHGIYQDNLAASPWIDLGPQGYNNRGPGKFIQTSLYTELPLLNYIFMQFNIQWYPDVCLVDPTNPFIVTSGWTSSGFVYYFGGVPQCVAVGQVPTRIDLSSRIPPGAEQVRIAIGVLSYCRYYANCTNSSNTTPWCDDVKLGVYGDPSAPLIAQRTLDVPMDQFPTNGTLNSNAPGRIDCNNIQGASSPEAGTSMGDTLVCQGAEDATTGAEVWVQFAVTPGPGTDPGNLSAWLSKFGAPVETRYGQDWYAARCDTAERAFFPVTGSWMTCWIEGNPNFSGSDQDLDPNDLDPNGNMTRLKNDMFADDLLTPGSRINIFFKTRFVGGSTWYTTPDTTGGTYNEVEILPSSMNVNGEFNCVLYVDHFSGRGAQPYIEDALTSVLGTGGSNFEGTNWDRYDVEAPSSQQASYGRPLNTEYGATVVQTLGYKTILWNSGNLDAFNLTKEDGDVLIPWLTLIDFDYNNLYLNGDGVVKSAINEAASEPSARRLVEDLAGVLFNCNTYRDLDCPAGKAEDTAPCVNLDPVAGALVAEAGGFSRSVAELGQGNGCPQQRSFDVLSANPSPDFGAAVGDEYYSTATTSSAPSAFASVANDAAAAGPLHYRTVVDGLSIHYRRDFGTPCDFTDGGTVSVTERTQEVMTFLATSATCTDPTQGIGIPDSRSGATFRTTLANFAPNPLLTGATGKIQFTMAKAGRAKIDVFDVNGRLVRSVLDKTMPEGPNYAEWNGTDMSGRQVASGVYFYRLRANGEDFSKQMVVVRNGGK